MSGPMRKWTKCSKSLKQHDARDMEAIVGGETGVSPFEDGDRHNNAPFPHSGNHTPGQDEVEEIEQGALPPRERDLEQGVRHSVKTHCRIHANPQSALMH